MNSPRLPRPPEYSQATQTSWILPGHLDLLNHADPYLSQAVLALMVKLMRLLRLHPPALEGWRRRMGRLRLLCPPGQAVGSRSNQQEAGGREGGSSRSSRKHPTSEVRRGLGLSYIWCRRMDSGESLYSAVPEGVQYLTYLTYLGCG